MIIIFYLGYFLRIFLPNSEMQSIFILVNNLKSTEKKEKKKKERKKCLTVFEYLKLILKLCY